MTVAIRLEAPADHAAVRRIHERAFGRPDEAALVDALRGSPHSRSLVAAIDGEIAGHVLLTAVSLVADAPGAEGDRRDSTAPPLLGLGPIAILPEQQRHGIGAALIRQALESCRRDGVTAVVVLGDPAFYARFGFVPGRAHGLRCEFAAPEEDAFMVCELAPGGLQGQSGLIVYAAPFTEVGRKPG